MTRTFRMVSIEKGTPVDGKFTGTPSGAARKAFNAYCKEHNKNTLNARFEVQETTKDSNNKTYSYVGLRQKLNPPQKISRGNVEYEVKYNTTVKSDK
jgi:hypothetical protein